MMAPICNLSHVRLRKEDQKLKVKLDYVGTTYLIKVGTKKNFLEGSFYVFSEVWPFVQNKLNLFVEGGAVCPLPTISVTMVSCSTPLSCVFTLAVE